MTHAEFVAAYRAGRIRLDIDPAAARRFVSARMMLSWILLPLLGIAVALALTGSFASGAATLAGALAFRWLVGASSAGYVAQRVLSDPAFFAAAQAADVLHATPR